MKEETPLESRDYRQNMNSMKVEEAQKSYTDIVLVSVKDSSTMYYVS